VNVRDGSRLAEDPFTQFRLAESAAEIGGAYDRMRDNMREMMSLAQAGDEIPLTRRARYRWDSAKAVDWGMRAVDRLMEASGGRGIFLKSDPAGLARHPCDARPYRQQSRACCRGVWPLRVRPPTD
jgi:alkylation response protein AidB-like acyl-CoA dehydrogenase